MASCSRKVSPPFSACIRRKGRTFNIHILSLEKRIISFLHQYFLPFNKVQITKHVLAVTAQEETLSWGSAVD
jgi:uncharacterized OB-fold protein